MPQKYLVFHIPDFYWNKTVWYLIFLSLWAYALVFSRFLSRFTSAHLLASFQIFAESPISSLSSFLLIFTFVCYYLSSFPNGDSGWEFPIYISLFLSRTLLIAFLKMLLQTYSIFFQTSTYSSFYHKLNRWSQLLLSLFTSYPSQNFSIIVISFTRCSKLGGIILPLQC